MSSTAASPGAGLVCAVLSACFNGSFTVPFKVAAASSNRSLADAAAADDANAASSPASQNSAEEDEKDGEDNYNKVHPIVFTLYVSFGVFLSSFVFIVPFLSVISINLPSILAGFLFVLGVSASFLAVDLIGMALSQGIWAGSATVVSYIWGTLIFGEQPLHPLGSITGLVLLVVGVVGIAFCNEIAHSGCFGKIHRKWKGRRVGRGRLIDMDELEPLGASISEGDLASNVASTFRNDGSEAPATFTSSSNGSNVTTEVAYASGVFWACSVGLFGGSILAPTHFLTPDKQGIAVLPSFGIGCAVLAPIVLVIHNYWTQQTPSFNARKALVPGLLSGLLWNVSNLLSLRHSVNWIWSCISSATGCSFD